MNLINKIIRESEKHIDIITLWHGTSKANHTKILKSGKFKSGTYFTDDEKTAKQYANLTRTNKPMLMYVAIDRNQLNFDGYYYIAKKDLYYKGGIYQ